jgi:hypothetical protein
MYTQVGRVCGGVSGGGARGMEIATLIRSSQSSGIFGLVRVSAIVVVGRIVVVVLRRLKLVVGEVLLIVHVLTHKQTTTSFIVINAIIFMLLNLSRIDAHLVEAVIRQHRRRARVARMDDVTVLRRRELHVDIIGLEGLPAIRNPWRRMVQVVLHPLFAIAITQ